jgi:hypothetical protein
MTHEDQRSIDLRLRRALDAAAQAESDQGAAAAVEARLLATVRSQRIARERRRQIVWLAAAAAIVVLVSAARWRLSPDSGDPAPNPTQPAVSAAADVPDGFLALRYAQVPTRGGQIVRMTVPATALASFGLEPASAGSDVVTADVFVGDDGLARAVRFTAFSPKELVQ